MADLARIKRNVSKMVGMSAPEADIDAYIASEGVTVDDVRAFKGEATPPAGAKPGSREYADWAALEARAGRALPQVSDAPPEWSRPNTMKSVLPGPIGAFQDFSNAVQSGFNQGLTLGFGDEIYAGATAIPRAAVDAFSGRGFDLGRAYDEGLTGTRQNMSDAAALNPVGATVGEVTGAVVNPLARGLGIGKAASTGAKIALGAGEGAALGGLYGFGSGETMDERLSGAGWGAAGGAVTGVVAPWLANKAGEAVTGVAQRRATDAAIKSAPAAADLKAASSALFQKVDQSGVKVDTNRFSQLVQDLVTKAKKDRISASLDPKAHGAYSELIGALDDVQKSGGALTVSDLHTLRQIAQKAAVSAEGRDAMFANRIVDALDDFVSHGGNLKLPPNQIGAPGGTNTAGNDLLEAISTWGRSRRVGLIEEAVYRAQNQASGFENGLRIQFRQLIQNPKTRKLFTKAELQAIEEVANGTALSNVTRLLGKFGFGGGSASNMLGGTIGFGAGSVLGGPLGGILAAGVGTGARKVGETLAKRGADRAAKVVATPNIPNVPAGPASIASEEALRRLGIVSPPALLTQ